MAVAFLPPDDRLLALLLRQLPRQGPAFLALRRFKHNGELDVVAEGFEAATRYQNKGTGVYTGLRRPDAYKELNSFILEHCG